MICRLEHIDPNSREQLKRNVDEAQLKIRRLTALTDEIDDLENKNLIVREAEDGEFDDQLPGPGTPIFNPDENNRNLKRLAEEILAGQKNGLFKEGDK